MFSDMQINEFIYAIDRVEDIHDFGFTEAGIYYSYWMLVRWDLFLILNSMIGCWGNPIDATPPKRTILNAIQLVYNAFKNRPKPINKCDILFLSTGIGTIDKGKYIENIGDENFILEMNKLGVSTLSIDMHSKMFKKRHNHIISYSMNWLYIKMRLRDMLCFKADVSVNRFSPFLNKINEYLLTKIDRQNASNVICRVRSILVNLNTYIPSYAMMLKKLFKLYNPSYVVMEGVSYGGSGAVISLIAKKQGIKVIEPQHGWIGLDHAAYNHYSETKRLNYLPDFFWGYGMTWLNSVNLPTKKVCIGNPFIASATQKKVNLDSNFFDLLIITDSTNIQSTISTVQMLSRQFARILFRPHPRELSGVTVRYSEVLALQNIQLDSERDHLSSILKSKNVIVIGNCVSTVGFEAVFLGKPVFVIADLKRDILAYEIAKNMMQFLDFNDADLIATIKQSKSKYFNDIDRDGLYHSAWKENLRNFFLVHEQFKTETYD